MTDTPPIPWHLDQRLAATLCCQRGLRQLQRRSITAVLVATVGVAAAATLVWTLLPTPGRIPHNPAFASPRMLTVALTMLIVAGVWMFALLPVALYRQRVLLHHCGACGHDLRLRPEATSCPTCGEPFTPPADRSAIRYRTHAPLPRPRGTRGERKHRRPRLSRGYAVGIAVPRPGASIAIYLTIVAVLSFAIGIASMSFRGWAREGVDTASSVVLTIGIFGLVWIGFNNGRFDRRIVRGHCAFCGYDLNPLPDATCCPECGQPIEPGTNRTPSSKSSPPTFPTQAQ